jgi:hypothetical protein
MSRYNSYLSARTIMPLFIFVVRGYIHENRAKGISGRFCGRLGYLKGKVSGISCAPGR